MADWSFRYRFKLSTGMSIASTDSECLLTDLGAAVRVVLRSVATTGDMNVPISEESSLVLRGSGFASPEEAEREGHRWVAALLLGFAANNLGADFGLRDPEPVVHLADLASHATEEHPVVLPDTHTVMIFESEPAPRFLKVDVGAMTVHKGLEHLLEAVSLAYVDDPRLTERQLRAFATYSSSFGMAPDARLITLVAAAEVLLDHRARMTRALALVEGWIENLTESDLPPDEKNSLGGSLNYMRNESIGRSIGRLAGTLGERRYQGETATTFLKRCYTLRSQLVHGTELPDWFEVALRGAELERMVADFIAFPLLERFEAEPAQTHVGVQIAPDWNGDPTHIPFSPISVQFGVPDESETLPD